MVLFIFVPNIYAWFLTEGLGIQLLRSIHIGLVTSKQTNGNIN
jgi:hypothetical protein